MMTRFRSRESFGRVASPLLFSDLWPPPAELSGQRGHRGVDATRDVGLTQRPGTSVREGASHNVAAAAAAGDDAADAAVAAAADADAAAAEKPDVFSSHDSQFDFMWTMFTVSPLH